MKAYLEIVELDDSIVTASGTGPSCANQWPMEDGGDLPNCNGNDVE